MKDIFISCFSAISLFRIHLFNDKWISNEILVLMVKQQGKEMVAKFSSNQTTINISSPVSVVVHIQDTVSLLHIIDIEMGSIDTEPPKVNEICYLQNSYIPT